MSSKALEGAAFAAGVGAYIFGGAETVMELGHYSATGLRKTADAIDWVTDAGQDFCRGRKDDCRQKKQELLERAAMTEAESREALAEMEAEFRKQNGETSCEGAESVEAEVVEDGTAEENDIKQRIRQKQKQEYDDAILV